MLVVMVMVVAVLVLAIRRGISKSPWPLFVVVVAIFVVVSVFVNVVVEAPSIKSFLSSPQTLVMKLDVFVVAMSSRLIPPALATICRVPLPEEDPGSIFGFGVKSFRVKVFQSLGSGGLDMHSR